MLDEGFESDNVDWDRLGEEEGDRLSGAKNKGDFSDFAVPVMKRSRGRTADVGNNCTSVTSSVAPADPSSGAEGDTGSPSAILNKNKKEKIPFGKGTTGARVL